MVVGVLAVIGGFPLIQYPFSSHSLLHICIVRVRKGLRMRKHHTLTTKNIAVVLCCSYSISWLF